MKRFVRCVCLTLVLAMFFTTTAFATEAITPRASDYFSRFGGYLSLTSGTNFGICFDVTATGTMTQLGAISVKVQRSADGSSGWTTMKTFNRSSYPQMIAENTGRHAATLMYTGTAGYYYRAYITFYAKNSSGIGQYTYYTSAIRVPSK